MDLPAPTRYPTGKSSHRQQLCCPVVLQMGCVLSHSGDKQPKREKTEPGHHVKHLSSLQDSKLHHHVDRDDGDVSHTKAHAVPYSA